MVVEIGFQSALEWRVDLARLAQALWVSSKWMNRYLSQRSSILESFERDVSNWIL